MGAKLDLKLHSLYCDAEKRGLTLHQCVNLYKGQHMIDYGFLEYEYSGLHDNSKVHMLINGINTKAIEACKSAILSSTWIQG